MKYLLLYFLFPYFSNSQSPSQELAEQLFKDKKLLWQKLYTGYWDQVIPVKLELASDGEAIKGFLYFGENQTKYVVNGKQMNAELRLEEQDLLGRNTGLLALELQGSIIKGTWYNAQNSYNAPLYLSESLPPAEPNYWIRSYLSKNDPTESRLILHKEFADQISAKFYYKLLNKTLFGTSIIKDEEAYSQEAYMADYLHNTAGTLNTWKINDRKMDLLYKLGSMEYRQSLELDLEVPIQKQVYADHWMAVDLFYPAFDRPAITDWIQNYLDSLLILVQEKKKEAIEDYRANENRLLFRMSVWPQIEYLSEQLVSGVFYSKTSWEEQAGVQPFVFDLKKGVVLHWSDMVENRTEFERIKNSYLQTELEKLKSSSALEYDQLQLKDFTCMTIKKEGLVFSAPFDMMHGVRQLVLPYYMIRETLSPKYFPLF
jgi:hypothetical protein